MEKNQNVKKYERCVSCGKVYFDRCQVLIQNCECGSDLFWIVEAEEAPLCVGGYNSE